MTDEPKMKYTSWERRGNKGFSGKCLNCGSNDVSITLELGFRGSDVTGADDPEAIIQCKKCNQFDQIIEH